MKRTLFFFLLFMAAVLHAPAQTRLELPMTYGNSMVLQRNQPITLSGKAVPGSKVTVIFALNSGKKVRRTADASITGSWKVMLPSMQAGGPHTLTIESGAEKRTLENVWIGEVWLCSGQSNMELPLSSIVTAKHDLQVADTLSRVHLFNMPSPWPTYAQVWPASFVDSLDRRLLPQTGEWKRCSAEAARGFSAIGFHFGRILADSLKCHVGLINNAVGGSTTEGWIDSISLATEMPEMLQGDWRKNPNIMEWARQRADYNLKAADPSRPHRHPYAPTFLFEEGLRPVLKHQVKGVLWYQGESNADLPEVHRRLFPLLEKSWRRAFQNASLPFLTVQLSSISTRPIWPTFRNSQRQLADSLSRTWMTVSSDLGDSLDVHPRRKAPIGERLSASALAHVYGWKGVVPSGPEPLQAEAGKDGSVMVGFRYGDGMHPQTGEKFIGFEVAGTDGVYHPADDIQVEGTSVRLRTAQVTHPCKVRYGWQAYTHANLVNGRGFPCSTFELDVK